MTTQTIAGEAAQIVTAYRITTTRAYMMSEVGVGYSWDGTPGHYNDHNYDEDTEEIEMAIPASAEVAESKAGNLMMYWRGDAYTAQEAVSSHVAIPQE